ncbi:MAG: MFS transporter [Actinobacteria bacterium]|nr:MFS transporter [Actinomycetota bacterium]MBT4037900.1 MFS transporter [Actinomycetota bacterium]MBT4279881.1 MFS transporter [Actinomycetota bacterium]MBT4343159.1 MFS transporter [Actinomycetota bacterium]MBT4787402.1 MFS transporter [Actinomycetota bacterium]
MAALGLLTITSYGSWMYGFGVLIGPISDDMGWSTTALGVTFGGAMLFTGLGSFTGGRLLDRFGGPGPFLLQALLGGGLLLASTWADHPVSFGLLYALGAGITGATGFYHVTTAAAARLRPHRPDQAITVVTLIGAFCSPIYLPLTAWMVTTWHWRTAARVLALLAVGGGLLAASLTSDARSTRSGPSLKPLDAIRSALGRPAIKRMMAAYVMTGIAFASVLVYQVPILTASGVSLAMAGTIGGLRGLFQFFGRLGLTGLVERHGSGALLRLAFLVSAAGIAFLLIGSIPAGLTFAILAGLAMGASTPLQSVYARSHFDEGDLGLLMGLQGVSMGLAGAIGPVMGGVMRDLSGSWTPTVVMGIVTMALGAWLLKPDEHRPVGETTLQ